MPPSPFDSGTINSQKEQSRRIGTTGLPHQHALGSAGRRGWTEAAYRPKALHCLRRQSHGVSVSAAVPLGQRPEQLEALIAL